MRIQPIQRHSQPNFGILHLKNSKNLTPEREEKLLPTLLLASGLEDFDVYMDVGDDDTLSCEITETEPLDLLADESVAKAMNMPLEKLNSLITAVKSFKLVHNMIWGHYDTCMFNIDYSDKSEDEIVNCFIDNAKYCAEVIKPIDTKC